MTPAGTSNELDVQNGWEENTHTLQSVLSPRVKNTNSGTIRILVRICEDTKSKGSEVVFELHEVRYRVQLPESSSNILVATVVSNNIIANKHM